MAVRVQWVGYGREAAEALRAEIARAKGGDPLAPATVVVPSNHVGVAARRLLASGALGPVTGTAAGVVAVSFVTPFRLAELLAAPVLAGSGRRPVSTPVIAAGLRATLHDSPGLFAPVAEHPATETALVATYRELREVSDAGLDAIARTGRRASEVVRVHRATRARLEPGWYDEQDLMRAAVDAIGAGGSPPLRDLGTPVLYLPQRLTPHMLRMLATLAAARDLAIVVGTTGVERADAEVARAIATLTDAAGAASGPAPAPVATRERTRIVIASDADDEVRAAVRRVVEAVRAGTPLDRIAILHAATEPYARLVHEHLAAAGIPSNGPSVVPLAGRVAGRALLGLLALPERDFRRQDVFAWLATAPVLRRGVWAPVVAWERLSRAAGVVSGRAQWETRLGRFVDELDVKIAAAENDDTRDTRDPSDDWRVARDRRNATRARELRDFVVGLIDDLARAAAKPRGWAEHAAWARRTLTAVVGSPASRDDWPADERKAAERVDAALGRLAALDAVEGAVLLDVFTRTLALELENDLGRIGRFGDGVLVGPIAMGVGLDLELVAVLGLAEGTCPAPVRDDSLLPDQEREAAAGELPLRRARVDREHRELIAALASARQQLLGVPRGDLRHSTDLVPSRWVLDLASALSGESWWSEELFTADVDWIEPVASFDAGLRALDFPATEQEHHLRTLLASPPANAAALAGRTDDAVLAGNAAVVAARRSSAFTRFDGNLTGLAVPSPVASVTSATRLQTWSSCPFAYFVESILRVEPVENPEEIVQIGALDRGSLVHEALEKFVLEMLAAPPAPNAPWTTKQRARMIEIGDAICEQYEARGVTGRSLYWGRDRRRVLADLERFLVEDDRLRAALRTTPVAAELPFGLRDGIDPVPLRLADGRLLHFRGMADRVDRADDGSLLVLDYKTGKRDHYKGLSAENPDRGGSLLQLPVYGVAARMHQRTPDAPVRALYWFVSQRGEFKFEGYDVTDGVLDLVGATLGWVIAGIEAGIFASHPTQTSTAIFNECPSCNPDELGVTELRSAWERKRDDAALVPYSKFAEPYEDEAGDA
ncbi:MAG TPA: PD-(D/E)XK nuclease family protein [Acidimicrobiia bacterium]|nr:PD-(D/E)XK nuclease family protein [Acidimicrobiia bacterium]